MLTAIGFLFLDFSGSVPSAWFRGLTWLQFVPSLFKFLQTIGHGLAVTAYGFIAVLALTLLFGRVYCSYICPLGVFQDVTSWCSKKVRKKFRFRFAPPKTRLRYSILVVVILSLFTGSIFLVNLLDPYSNFGRFASDLFRPVYIMGNNVLVKIFEALGSYALYPVTVAKNDPFAFVVPLVMLALVIWLSVWKGRLYCNMVCPVGTLLGLVSKVSLYKIRMDEDKCNRCGKCMFVCKSQCIDSKNREVDFSRCVGCGNCIKACDKNAIRYSLALTSKPEIKGEPAQHRQADVSKRHFLFGSAFFIASLSGLSIKSFAQPLVRRSQIRRRNRKRGDHHELGHGKGKMEVLATHTVTPPGSLNHHHFTRACTACHLCVSACPTGVLKPSLFEYGLFGMMQPYMDYDASFCNYECTRCTEVCPNGAILPLTTEEKLTTQIGVARFEKHNCVVFADETSCGSCSEHCPTQAVRMVPYKGELTIPEVTPEICVGCGACEYACPVTPYKAIVVDGHLEHKEAQKPEEVELEEKPLEDFPF
jgi:ferredoxin-type protein NapF